MEKIQWSIVRGGTNNFTKPHLVERNIICFLIRDNGLREFHIHLVWQIREGFHFNFWLDKQGPYYIPLITIITHYFVDTTLNAKGVVS